MGAFDPDAATPEDDQVLCVPLRPSQMSSTCALSLPAAIRGIDVCARSIGGVAIWLRFGRYGSSSASAIAASDVRAAPSAVSRASSSGASALVQDCGETVVRRRLGELALVSVSPKRGVGVAFECSRARKIAAQREDERQVLDRNRDVGVVRLARGMDPDRLARCRDRARKIVHRDEIAREVDEQAGESWSLSAPDRTAGSVSRTIAIARCV